MDQKTLYTAVGHFEVRNTPEGRYPVILVNRREYMVDLQEMVLWTCLNWRLQSMNQLRCAYDKQITDLPTPPARSFEDGVARLVTRGLAVSGSGDTSYDALYDLLGGLYVVPISDSLPMRLWVSLKMLLLDHVPFSKVRQLFQRDTTTSEERRVLELSRQALLSTAEIIKCVERGVYDVSSEEKVLDALYDDMDTTSGNIVHLMRDKPHTQSVVTAIANLYLRRRIIFQRV